MEESSHACLVREGALQRQPSRDAPVMRLVPDAPPDIESFKTLHSSILGIPLEVRPCFEACFKHSCPFFSPLPCAMFDGVGQDMAG